MKIKPIVLLDVDGVIANFTKFYVECAEYVGAIPYGHVEDGWHPTHWNTGEALGLTRDSRAAVWNRIGHPNVGLSIQPYQGAIEGVIRLMQVADVYFPTSPIYQSPTWEYDRWHWFKRYFNEYTADRLIFTKDKTVIFGHVFVDDKPEHIRDWKKRWGSGYAVLWPQPYNADVLGEPVELFRPNKPNWNQLYIKVLEAAQRGEAPSWTH